MNEAPSRRQGTACSRKGALGVLATFVCALTVDRPAHAADDVAFDVRCPALTEPQRASFEARARASLGLRSGLSGTLSIWCDDAAVKVVFQPRGGAEQTRTMALPRSASELAERLLEAVDEVSREDAYASESATPLLPGKLPPPPAGPATAQNAGEASARSGASVAPPPDRPPDLVAPARGGASVALAVGGDSELGPATPATRLGPHAGVEAVIDAAVFDANVGVRWALDAPEGLSVRVVDVGLLAGVRLGPGGSIEVGGGPALGIVTVSGDALSPSAQTDLLFALALRARLRLLDGPIRFAFGPELRGYPRTVATAIDGREVLRLPVVTAGLTLDGAVRLAGGR